MTDIIALNVVAHGDTRLPRRFWDKTQISATGCWEWTAQIGHHGYARYRFNDKTARAHRVAYQVLVGAVPTGLVLDHLCRVRHCVNPAHLEPVTNRENLRRGMGPGMKGLQSHCSKGHEMQGDNLMVHSTRGTRFCRECHRERNRAWYLKNRASKVGGAA